MENLTKNREIKWGYIIIFVVVIGVIGILLLEFTKKKDNDKENTPTPEVNVSPTATPEEEIVLDVNGAEVTTLFKTMDNEIGVACGNFLYFTDKKFVASDFENHDVYNIAVGNMGAYNLNTFVGSDFTAAQLDETIAKIFGSEYKFNHQTYSGCPTWNYNTSTKTYEYKGDGCGGICISGVKKAVKAVKKGTKIEIDVRVLFNGRTDDSISYYKDYQNTIKVDGLDEVNGMPTDSDANMQKGSLYKVIFEYKNGNYTFASSEPVA